MPSNLPLYTIALTHASAVQASRRAQESYERLEFLGDAVLGMLVSEYLCERYPDQQEGFLTRMRTKLVNGDMLSKLAIAVGLSRHIAVGVELTAEAAGGRARKRLCEDVFEAFLAALYLDLGLQAARQWLQTVYEMHVDFADLLVADLHTSTKDHLTKLLLRKSGHAPSFLVTPTHDAAAIHVCVKDVHGNVLGVGQGPTKRAAENMAAAHALEYLGVAQ